MNTYETKFLASLAATLAIEIPVVYALVEYVWKEREIRRGKTVFVAAVASILTLPNLWFVLPAFIEARTPYLVVGETLVFLAEAMIYWRFLGLSLTRSFIVSFAANFISAAIGILYQS